MKRLGVFILLICLTASFFTACGKEQKKIYTVGEVLSVTGNARVYMSDGSIVAYNGLIIKNGDTISVDHGADVRISLGGGRYAVIEEGSDVIFDRTESGTEKLTAVNIKNGGMYFEFDDAIDNGQRVEVHYPDGFASVDGGRFRISVEPDNNTAIRATTAQSISGSIIVSASNAEKENIALLSGQECRIERLLSDSSLLPYFVYKEQSFDPYQLPYAYIGLGEEGLFLADGTVIDKGLSDDLSVKEIKLLGVNGESIPIEFDESIPSYVIETATVPAFFTISANHPRTKAALMCYGCENITSNGNKGEITFDSENKAKRYDISVTLTAENGSVKRYSVLVIMKKADQ